MREKERERDTERERWIDRRGEREREGQRNCSAFARLFQQAVTAEM